MLTDIERELEAIKERNKRVEAEKAWERSRTRILSLTLSTYLIAGIVLWIIGSANPWRNAFIPAIGFFLSVQSLPLLKRKWIAGYIQKQND